MVLFLSRLGTRAQEFAFGRLWQNLNYEALSHNPGLEQAVFFFFFLTASGTPMLMHRFSLNRISLSKDSTRQSPPFNLNPSEDCFFPVELHSFLVEQVKQRQTSLFSIHFMILPS